MPRTGKDGQLLYFFLYHHITTRKGKQKQNRENKEKQIYKMVYLNPNIFIALEKVWKYIQIESSSQKITGTEEEKQYQEKLFSV